MAGYSALAQWREAPMTTGPGDEKPAGGPRRGHLRASDADREQVIAALRAAFIQGRLTRDEFDLRVGRALGSRTYAELAGLTANLPAALTADLPAGLTGLTGHDALQAGIKPRHRRRAWTIAGSLAAIAVIAAAISVASLSHRPAPIAPPRPAGAVMYVAASNGVIPVRAATNTPGRPIKIGGFPWAVAITPDGSTAYVVTASARITRVTPVATATNTPGKPISIGGIGHFTDETAIAITPDGKTTYIATAAYIAGNCAGCPVGTVIPVATATNTPGKPIKIGRIPEAIAITPANGGGMLQKLLPGP
jgi:DNA-binding beta-propeller fold protein YncE